MVFKVVAGILLMFVHAIGWGCTSDNESAVGSSDSSFDDAGSDTGGEDESDSGGDIGGSDESDSGGGTGGDSDTGSPDSDTGSPDSDTDGPTLTIPRGRPVLNAARTTFVAENGQLLRGPYTSSEWGDPAPYEELENMKNMGFNAIHLYAECFDIQYPQPGSTAPGYSATRMDSIVEATRDLGLYLIITIGNGANNGNFNNDYVMGFWELYAPRYADETHVLYEIQNEPVGWSPPYHEASNGAMDMQIAAYNAIRTHAPHTPVLLFSYSVLWGSGAGNDALEDIRIFNQAVFGNQNATWENLAVAFHGYAGSGNTVDALGVLQEAGYPVVMTEYHGNMWGADSGGFDVEMTYQLERLEVSWLSFVFVPPWGVSDSVTRPDVYLEPVVKTGLSWRPDFGTFPAVRGTYNHQGRPWGTADDGDKEQSETIRIQAEDFDEGGKGVAYNNSHTGTGGSYRAHETVQISPTTDTDKDGGYQVGGHGPGDWLEYTLRVPGGLYTVALRMAGQGSVRILSRDEDLTGVWALPNTGDASTWSTAERQVFLPGGLQRFRIQIEAGGFNLDWIELSPISSGPISNGLHLIENVGTGQRLNLDGDTVVMSASGRDWEVDHIGGGEYTVGANGAFWTLFMGPLHLTPSWGAEGFFMRPFGDGTYRMVHSGGGLCLQPSTTNAPQLETVACSNDANQRWTIP